MARPIWSALIVSWFGLATGCASIVGVDLDGYSADDGSDATPDGGSPPIAGTGNTGNTGNTGGTTSQSKYCDPRPDASTTSATIEVCAGDEQCALDGDEDYHCFDRTESGAAGDACENDRYCSAGLGCVNGTCRELCDPAADDCSSSEACVNLAVVSAGAIGYCAIACSPANPVECAADERCDFPAADALHGPFCAGPAGDAVAYTECSSNADCTNDLGCQLIGTKVDATEVSLCLPWTSEDSECVAPEELKLPESAPTVDGTSYGYCYGSCDPTEPTAADGFRACAAEEHCAFLDDASGTKSLTSCLEPGTLQTNALCTVDDECMAGLACRAVCTEYCKLGQDETCPLGKSCNAFTNIRKLGTTEYGYCREPSNCDPLSQSPCLGGTRCFVAVDEFAVCIPDEGTRKAGQQCATQQDCTDDTYCVGSAARGYYCSQYCRVGMSDCGAKECFSDADPVHVDGVEFGHCEKPNCNPFEASAGDPFVPCTSGLECHFAGVSDSACMTDFGAAARGEMCEGSKDCQQGLYCAFTDDVGYCYEACRMSLGTTGNPDCSADAPNCASNTFTSVMEGMEIGYCTTN